MERKQKEEVWGILLTPVVEKNELEGSLEPSNRSSVSNYRHTHQGEDRQKPKGTQTSRQKSPGQRHIETIKQKSRARKGQYTV